MKVDDLLEEIVKPDLDWEVRALILDLALIYNDIYIQLLNLEISRHEKPFKQSTE